MVLPLKIATGITKNYYINGVNNGLNMPIRPLKEKGFKNKFPIFHMKHEDLNNCLRFILAMLLMKWKSVVYIVIEEISIEIVRNTMVLSSIFKDTEKKNKPWNKKKHVGKKKNNKFNASTRL